MEGVLPQDKMEAFFSSLASNWDDRHTLSEEAADHLLRPLDLREGERVVDLACGRGVMTEHILRKTSTPVLGIDISKRMVELAKEDYADEPKVSFLCADLLGFEGSFDKALMFNAFPHFKDVKRLEESFNRMLVSGGKLLVIHNLGKAKLNQHHANVDSDLFRDVNDAKIEAYRFDANFRVLEFFDEPSRYGFLLEKK